MRLWMWSLIIACSPASESLVEEGSTELPTHDSASGAETRPQADVDEPTRVELPTTELETPIAATPVAETPDTSAAPPDVCPTDVDGPVRACRDEGRRCPLADGDCICARHPVVQGVARAPGEELPSNPRAWDCRPAVRADGCPGRPPSGRCSREGQQCGYRAHEAQTICSLGTWVALPPQPVP